VLAPHEPAASGSPLDLSLRYLERRSRALLRGSRPVAERADLLERAQIWHTGPEWDALLAHEHAWTAVFAGRPADALRCVGTLAEDERVSHRRRFHLCAVAMNSLGRLSRLDDFRAVAQRAKHLAEAMGLSGSDVRVTLMTVELMPMVRAGRDLAGIEAALVSTRSEASRNGDRALLTAALILLGVLSLRRGHAGTAVAYLEETAEALTEADAMNNALFVALTRVEAHAMHGDPDRAQALLAEVERLALAHPHHARRQAAEIETAHAQVAASAGRTSAAAARLLAVADGGYANVAAEITSLYEALRLGADPRRVADALRSRVDAAQDELGELFLAHADALAGDDAAAQLSAARGFHDRGLDLYAAEAAARAARSFAAAGRTASSREATSLATKYAAPCGRVSSWALQVRPDGPALTDREREIATLAARGRMNKEIADELFLSVRTVEGHLLRACQKLGVENRRGLPAVIDH
jgi:ATP/maltotriose-dependent transcriptional regulator MalT